ncbi:MAG: DUF2783 domain-containing protein [Pseudomonadota bacterium]|jgi:hypothetical protein
MPLNLEPNFHEPGKHYLHGFSPGDEFYELLIKMHRPLSEAESIKVNARLILLLANHIGDLSVLREAMTIATQCATQE